MSDEPVLVGAGQEFVVADVSFQMRILTRLIQREPDEPVHYVLRGEEWLAHGEIARACADFAIARRLADARAAQSDWGYLYQAYSDRAMIGLRCCGVDDYHLVNCYHGSDF